jgi:cytochrome P450
MTTTAALPVTYNPFVDTSRADPYALYGRLRDEAPVYHNPERGFWALSRFDDVVAAAHDPDRYLSGRGITLGQGEGRPTGFQVPTIITMDNPRHDQLRRLVSRGFTGRQTGGFEPRVRAAARALVDQFADAPTVELVEAMLGPLPIIVISELLGVDDSERDAFKGWADTMLRQQPDQPDTIAAARDAAALGERFATEVIEARRRQPTDDLVSQLLAAEIDGERLTDAEILGFCLVLLVAGTETTTNLIGNGLLALLDHRDQLARLRADRSLLPNAVEEMLRWCGPVHQLTRTTACDVEVHGVTIPADAQVALVWAAANRDPREFGDDAGEFRIDRTIERHVAFGHGIHFCLGAALARLEARIAFEELFDRFSAWELVDPQIDYAPSSNIRTPAALHLEVIR